MCCCLGVILKQGGRILELRFVMVVAVEGEWRGNSKILGDIEIKDGVRGVFR